MSRKQRIMQAYAEKQKKRKELTVDRLTCAQCNTTFFLSFPLKMYILNGYVTVGELSCYDSQNMYTEQNAPAFAGTEFCKCFGPCYKDYFSWYRSSMFSDYTDADFTRVEAKDV